MRTKNRLGYAPVAVGFLLIVLGVIILLVELSNNDLNGFNASSWTSFYQFWVAIISLCFVAGAFLVVVGVVSLTRITNLFSYALLAGGFALIILEVYRLVIQVQGEGYLGIGWSDFQSNWSLGFFSFLVTGIFLILVGIILGLRIRYKVGYVIMNAGSAIMLFGLFILSTNLATSLNYYPSDYLFSLQEAWNSIIYYSLIVGVLLMIIGVAYLKWRRVQKSG
jgi:hypothetical protein